MRMAELLGIASPPPAVQRRVDLNRRTETTPDELSAMLAELDAGDADARRDAAQIRAFAADRLARARSKEAE
ncbi:MAG TPA: hypothetical protein VFU19_11490 [Iamia sp.]|nr:hypothetical protein [Iamia sp.]